VDEGESIFMKEIVNLSLRTEFSFKSKFTYGRIKQIGKHHNDTGYLGICDVNGTYGFVQFEKYCLAEGLKPIFGVRLQVLQDKDKKTRGASGPEYIFIAKNNDGLAEINKLTKSAYENFYYKPFLLQSEVAKISENVFVIAESFYSPERVDYIALTTTTPRMMLEWDIPKVAINNNYYPDSTDKINYELLCGARKHGDGFRFMFNDQTYPMHILSTAEWYRIWRDDEAIENTHRIAEQCNVSIPVAEMVKFPDEVDIKRECIAGAKRLGVDLDDPVYKERFERELSIIIEKEFVDYFLVVSDMIKFAKKNMLVGPSRGSCAGSLICYLLDITTIDPIPFDLVFERFIDLNRHDMPDIDIDFPDHKRQDVIKYLIKKYRPENVCHIANINRLKAKSAIGNTAMALSIPFIEAENVKDSIVDRSGGDARAAMAAKDTLESTQVGKDFLEKYPAMNAAFDLEMHATHTGKHAGGIIVCNDDITKYSGMNARDGCIMMDKKDAEAKNLLKIDVLGLRTLTILEQAAEMAGFDYHLYYEMPLDIEKTFTVFNEMRLSGIFQFEGQAMMMLCKEMGVYSFEDIVALTALARPGPLHSGGANKYIKRRIGVEEVQYDSNHPLYVEVTKDTYGIIVYQEQLMNICRMLGKMSWEEVSDIRRAASKTLGKEFFDRYRNSFLKGTAENGVSEKEAVNMWEGMITFGSWAMNRSHTVAYGLISYWCAFMKTHYPLEFAAATMNNIKSEDAALIMLRDMKENDGIEYIDVDPDVSDVHWTIHDGKLLGGLTNIKGLAEKSAQEIVKLRKSGKPLKNAMYKKLISSPTPYQILYPTKHWWGDLWDNYSNYGLQGAPTFIRDIDDEGEYVIVGKVVQKDLRDLNEYNELVKRNGKVLTENDKFLRLVVEDDTGKILCKIDRFNFNNLDGQYWSENAVVDKTWLIIKGKISKGWRVLNITALFNLEHLEYHGKNNLILSRQQEGNKVLGSRVGL
jgi:DNA polymerase III alpha subunit